jgi:hypothetical protein
MAVDRVGVTKQKHQMASSGRKNLVSAIQDCNSYDQDKISVANKYEDLRTKTKISFTWNTKVKRN